MFTAVFHVVASTLPPIQTSKWAPSKVNYLTLMCKKPTGDTSQKNSKRHNRVTFFWLVKNYTHFSYSKCDWVVKRSEIGKFGKDDEKCYIQKHSRCVTYVWLIRDPLTHLTPIYDPSIIHLWFFWKTYVTIFDPHVTYLWPIFSVPHDPYVIHLWPIFDSCVNYVRLICD